MDKIMLVLVIVITIAYLSFSIWNVFITKKQITMSVVDLLYCMALGGLTAMFSTRIPGLIAIIFLGIWLMITGDACRKNYQRKNKEKM